VWSVMLWPFAGRGTAESRPAQSAVAPPGSTCLRYCASCYQRPHDQGACSIYEDRTFGWPAVPSSRRRRSGPVTRSRTAVRLAIAAAGGPCCAPRRTFSKSRRSRGVDAGSGVCGGPSRRVGADVSKPQGVQPDSAGGGAVGRPNRRVSTVGGNIDAVAVKYADAECIEVPRLRPENPQSIRETRGHVSRAFFSAVTPR